MKSTTREGWSFDLRCPLVWLTHLTSPKQHKPNKALHWGLGWLAVRSQKPAICGGSLPELGILLVKCLQELPVQSRQLFSIFITGLKSGWELELAEGSDRRVRESDSDSDRSE